MRRRTGMPRNSGRLSLVHPTGGAATLVGLMHHRRIPLSEAEVIREVAVAMLESRTSDHTEAPSDQSTAIVVSLDNYRRRRVESLTNPA